MNKKIIALLMVNSLLTGGIVLAEEMPAPTAPFENPVMEPIVNNITTNSADNSPKEEEADTGNTEKPSDIGDRMEAPPVIEDKEEVEVIPPVIEEPKEEVAPPVIEPAPAGDIVEPIDSLNEEDLPVIQEVSPTDIIELG